MSDSDDLMTLHVAASFIESEVRSGSLSSFFVRMPLTERFEGACDGWGMQVGKLIADPKLRVSVYVDRSWGTKKRKLWIGLETVDSRTFGNLTSKKLPKGFPRLELTTDDAALLANGFYRIKARVRFPRVPTVVLERYPNTDEPGFYLGFYNDFAVINDFLSFCQKQLTKVAASIPVVSGTLTLTAAPVVARPNSGSNNERVVDWTTVNDAQRRLGAIAERAVFTMERGRLGRGKHKHLSKKVVHVSQVRGDGAGYDIESFDENGQPIFIEVKATSSKTDKAFLITKTELSRFRSDTRYRIYRLYNFNPNTGSGSFYIIDDIGMLAFEAETYSATPMVGRTSHDFSNDT